MRPIKPFETLSDLLDDYYRDKAERDRVQQQASELIRKVENDLEKNRKKLAKQEAELAATDNAEEFRQKRRIADNLPPSGTKRPRPGCFWTITIPTSPLPSNSTRP